MSELLTSTLDKHADTKHEVPHRNISVANMNALALHSGIPSLHSCSSQQQFSPYNFGIASPERRHDNNCYGAVCLDSVESHTGIRMTANAAGILSEKEIPNAILDFDDINRSSNLITIQKPLNPGDIIDTICLPYLGSIGSERLLCECSIVFNRFITANHFNEQPGNESVQKYTNCFTRTYKEKSSTYLEDIINENIESECDHEQGDSEYNDSSPIIKNVQHIKGNRYGQKMEVYTYKEPLVNCDIKKEMSKNVVPELLNNPAVVKYLESVADEAVPRTDSQITVTTEGQFLKTHDVRVKNDSKNKDEANEGHISNVNEKTVCIQEIIKHSDEDLKDGHKSPEIHNLKGPVNRFDFNLDNNQINGKSCHITGDRSSSRHSGAFINFELGQDAEITGVFNKDESDTTTDLLQTYTHSLDNLPYIESVSNRKGSAVGRSVLVDRHNEFTCSYCISNVCSKHESVGFIPVQESCQKDVRNISQVKPLSVPVIHDNIKMNFEKSVFEEVQAIEEGLFYCYICDVVLPTNTVLTEHMNDHKEDVSMKENIVKLDGTSASDVIQAADSDSDCFNEREINDEMDDKEQEVNDLAHGLIIESTSRSKRRRGTKCDPNSLKENVCKKLKKRRSNGKKFICDNCGVSFTFLSDCLKHTSACEVQSNVLKCFQGCGQVFKTRSELDYHKKFCSRRISYCQNFFRLVKKFKKAAGDIDFSTGTKSDNDDDCKLISCKYCEFICPFKDFSVHLLECKNKTISADIKSDNEEISLNCQYCNRCFPSPGKMKFHELVCRQRPLQKCEFCDFNCKGNKPMSEHLVNRHNVRPFKCDFCDKMFKLKGSLKSHVKFTHTKETFTCEFCGKSFLKQSVYRSHVSIQHEGFRFVCKYCDKAFKDKRTWMTHEKSHKGAYDYACTVCKRTFNKSTKYKNHMKEVHLIDGEAALALNKKARELRDKMCTNVCNVCGERFPLKDAYHQHMLKEHGVLY